MIRIITWLWHQPQGRAKYNAQHVNTFAEMLRRHCSIRYSLACVTDIPEGIDRNIEIIPLPSDFAEITPRWGPKKPNCYRRLSLFRRDAAEIFGGNRIASFDLDCVIGGDLAPVLDREEDFAVFNGTHPSRPYNGSLQLLTAGCRPQVYELFSQDGADASGDAFYGSDQAWLAHCLGPDEAKWGEADGVWFYGSNYRARIRRRHIEPRIVFFPGKVKPWDAIAGDHYVIKHYRKMMKEAA